MTKDELLTALKVACEVAEWDADDLGHPGVRATRQYLALALQQAQMIPGDLDGELRSVPRPRQQPTRACLLGLCGELPGACDCDSQQPKRDPVTCVLGLGW